MLNHASKTPHEKNIWKWKKTFKTEKSVVLAEYFEQQTDCNR